MVTFSGLADSLRDKPAAIVFELLRRNLTEPYIAMSQHNQLVFTRIIASKPPFAAVSELEGRAISPSRALRIKQLLRIHTADLQILAETAGHFGIAVVGELNYD